MNLSTTNVRSRTCDNRRRRTMIPSSSTSSLVLVIVLLSSFYVEHGRCQQQQDEQQQHLAQQQQLRRQQQETNTGAVPMLTGNTNEGPKIGQQSPGLFSPEGLRWSQMEEQILSGKDCSLDSVQSYEITDLNDQNFFIQYNQWNDILEGDGLLIPTSQLPEAVCEFRELRYISHFPHAMQQLFRCWSWWAEHKDLPAILLWPRIEFTGRYTVFIVNILKKNFNLQVVPSYEHMEYVVRPKDTHLFESTLEILDYAMLRPQHAYELSQLFVQEIRNMTLFPDFQPAGCTSGSSKEKDGVKRYPTIGIVNRELDARRSIQNSQELMNELQKQFPNSIIREKYFKYLSVLEQIKFTMESDILISPHGAQLTNAIFLPSSPTLHESGSMGCSNVMEFFPENYLFGVFFASLAKAAGVRHSFMYVAPENAPLDKKYHYVTDLDQRELQLCLPIPQVIDAVHEMVNHWMGCCGKNL